VQILLHILFKVEISLLYPPFNSLLEAFQVVSQYSSLLAPLAVDAVLNVIDPARPDNVDLRDIKVLKKLGGTVSI
jgi:chaperonin GroEL (HSP60 family)